jgi:hypothetical protein
MYSSTVIDDKSTIHRIFPVRWKNYIVCTSDLYCFFFRNGTIIQASIFVHRSKSTQFGTPILSFGSLVLLTGWMLWKKLNSMTFQWQSSTQRSKCSTGSLRRPGHGFRLGIARFSRCCRAYEYGVLSGFSSKSCYCNMVLMHYAAACGQKASEIVDYRSFL